jgi:L-ascorbate metabolism protein UlaG (beta-lactamase superfamily)
MTTLTWIRQSGYQLKGDDGIIYIDPICISDSFEPADVIFLTHTHQDHFSLSDIKKISTPHTIIVATEDVVIPNDGSILFSEIILVKPHEMGLAGFVSYQTIPAYNTNKTFHPKHKEWVGYVIEFDSRKFYFTGDTDVIPEFSEVGTVDVCCLPVSGTYVMTALEAMGATKLISAKLFIPCHYGYVVGSEKDAQIFCDGVTHSKMLKEGESIVFESLDEN